MNEDEIERLLKAFPGAMRTARGVLIKNDAGDLFHALSSRPTIKLADLRIDEYFLVDFCSESEILRQRNLKNAHDYLLRMRAEAIANSPRMVRVMMKRRDIYESQKRPWSLTHYYHSMDSFHKSYIDALPRPKSKILKAIPAGLVPIVEANAACLATLVGEIVVVSESLFHFYYFMTIAVFGAGFDIAISDRMNALLVAYRIMNGAEAPDFDLDPRGALPPRTEAKIQKTVFDQMQFTFGHEYAHYLCGHVSTASVVLPENNASARAYAHNLEFEADLQAIRLIQQAPEMAERVALGAFSVLIFLHLLHRLKVLYGLKRLPVSETHPEPIDRIWALQKSLGSRSPLAIESIGGLLRLCRELANAFPHLIERSQRSDVLTMYGSVYLPSYCGKPKVDRIDF